jgi:hypothetical protein
MRRHVVLLVERFACGFQGGVPFLVFVDFLWHGFISGLAWTVDSPYVHYVFGSQDDAWLLVLLFCGAKGGGGLSRKEGSFSLGLVAVAGCWLAGWLG